MSEDYRNLNADKARIWRIVHRDNLPWIFDHGLHCANSAVRDPGYVEIGNPELINKRRTRTVPLAPHGTLADYVPFYFTSLSPMLFNIHTGQGVRQRTNEEIVILVSSLHKLKEKQLRFVFTDAHAYPEWATYFDDLSSLDAIDWDLLQRRDFKKDLEDLRKFDRYQAEALVYTEVPLDALTGIVCYNEAVMQGIRSELFARHLTLPIHIGPKWYFQ